jgi:hypothetical protein
MKLPSGTSYYPADVIEFNEMGEIGVMPMTGQDEMLLKNPDALLNGEALIEVIKNCVPCIKNAKMLLSNDIDAIVTAIRYATFNDSLETNLVCPECKHENNFKLDLQYSLDKMEYLDETYVVNLDSGASVFVRPYIFPEMLKALHIQFEQTKLSRKLDNESLTDGQRSAIFANAFKEIATTRFDLLASAIIKVVDESKDVSVTDKKYIREFITNIDKKSADKISDLIGKINMIGIKKTFMAKCEKCNHEWESEIDFNPVNFS